MYLCLAKALISHSPCICCRNLSTAMVALLAFVDDMVIIGESSCAVQATKRSLT